jgi:hypothetical protein
LWAIIGFSGKIFLPVIALAAIICLSAAAEIDVQRRLNIIVTLALQSDALASWFFVS